MYRVQNVFKMITQLSLVADASTHSGKEILVSCAYSPGQSLGCHAVIQHLNTGSLKPSEVDVSVLARIAKNRKLQRMSAFRQLQAINKQLALLSDNRLRLDAFSLNDVVDMEKMKKTLLNQKRKKRKKQCNRDASLQKPEAQGMTSTLTPDLQGISSIQLNLLQGMSSILKENIR